jgi:hypothetical protein
MKAAMWFSRFLKHLSELSSLRLVALRYAVNAIGVVEIALLPTLLAPAFYAEVETTKQMMLFAPALLFGASTGYLHSLFSRGRDLQGALLLGAAVVGIVGGAGFAYASGSLLAGCAVLLLVMATAVEKILVSVNRLLLGSLYKALVSVSLVCAVLAITPAGMFSATDLYATAALFGCLAWLGATFWVGAVRLPAWRTLGRTAADFRELVVSGFALNAQTYLILLYFIIDRMAVAALYPERNAEYAIAYSVSQIMFIFMNTIAFSMQYVAGKNAAGMTVSQYRQMRRTVLTLYGIIFLASIPCVYAFSLFVPQYGNFINSFLLIASLAGVFYALSAISLVGFYLNLSPFALKLMGIALVLNALAIVLTSMLDLGYYANLLRTGAILAGCAFLYDRKIVRTLEHGGIDAVAPVAEPSPAAGP